MKNCASFLTIVLISLAAPAQTGFTSQQANAYIARNDGAGALRYATEWAKAEPNNFYAWVALGTAYGMGLHQPENAIAAFQRALALKPDSPQCLNAMGDEYVNLKNYSQAIDFFRRAAEMARVKPTYWNNLAAAYSYQNKRDLALEALDSDQKFAGPTAGYFDWYVLGNGFYHLLEYQKALYAFQQSVRLNPRFANAWNNLGTAQQWLGNATEALQAYQRAGQLGDSLGNKNYTALQNAILEAQRKAENAGKPKSALERLIALKNAQWAYDHSWHDPADMKGRPN